MEGTLRGQKFEVNLDDEEDVPDVPDRVAAPPSFASVGDVLERQPAAPTPPSAPSLKSKTGFPEHKKRNVESRFKQRKNIAAAASTKQTPAASSPVTSTSGPGAETNSQGSESGNTEAQEKRQIDQENQGRLAGMSDHEIEEARRELMGSLDPALLQMLLKRSNIDEGSNESDFAGANEKAPAQDLPEVPEKEKPAKSKRVTFRVEEEEEEESPVPEPSEHEKLDDPNADALPHDGVHFPQPSQPPDLNPDSATFLEDLHTKYFPSLPSDPSKLEWMRDNSSTTKSSYDPSASSLNPKDIRFSFKGELIPPRLAASIPVSAGLHHHGDAPESAGYTIAELSHLSRSTYAAQRCVAFQTLGRLLYRLGRGEFGDPSEPGADTVGAEDTMGELARGLWREMEKNRVVDHLTAESEGNGVDGGKHMSAKAYATEAIWLWNKGGGRRWKAE